MSPLLIITGPPCAGKTTIARLLAGRHARGLHIPSDGFYAFASHPIPPYLAGAHEQNTSVIKAAVRCAASFANDGYEVFLDGVFGAWFLPLIAQVLRPLAVPVELAALDVDLVTALERARSRGHGSETVVTTMHAAFAAQPLPQRHSILTTGRAPADVVQELERRRKSGDFRLDLSGLAQQHAG
jgi:predicted kinase